MIIKGRNTRQREQLTCRKMKGRGDNKAEKW